MKHTFFKGLFLVSLLVVAVGCGKDGGGGGSNNYTSNPITSGQGNENISSSAIQSYNVIVNWKNNLQSNPLQERALMAAGRGYSRGVLPLSNNNTSTPTLPSNCKYVGPEWLNFVYCTGSGSTTQPTVTPTSVVEKRCTALTYDTNGTPILRYMNASSLSNSGCVPTGGETTYSIANNAELNQLLAFQKGKILQISGSGVYTVYVGNKVPEGYSSPVTAIYTIDTTKHSIYSPTSVQTSNTEITTIYEAY